MTYRARRMLVVDRLLNIPIHTHRAAVWRLSSSRAAFLKLRVSFLPSVIPILMVMHRNTVGFPMQKIDIFKFKF